MYPVPVALRQAVFKPECRRWWYNHLPLPHDSDAGQADCTTGAPGNLKPNDCGCEATNTRNACSQYFPTQPWYQRLWGLDSMPKTAINIWPVFLVTRFGATKAVREVQPLPQCKNDILKKL